MTNARDTFTLAGCRVVDPTDGSVRSANIVVEDGEIRAVGEESAGLRIECEGLTASPGLVDLSAHLRQPGREDAETIASGTAAAAAGGFTCVSAMPTTDPPADHAGVVEQILRLARDEGHCDVRPIGAITKGREGHELSEMGAMHTVGVRMFSDADRPIRSSQVMRRALTYAKTWDAIICNQPLDTELTRGAQMHEGALSSSLGLKGSPREAEEIGVARDLLLAERAGARLHLLHLSTRRSVEQVREAKARGVRVTCDVTPHHLALDASSATSYDTSFKVDPPLRDPDDVEALRDGLRDGTIDAIATDHSPHPPDDKDTEWATAPSGTVGLETALAVVLDVLVDSEADPRERGSGTLSLVEALRAFTVGPTRACDISGHGRPVAAGQPANLIVFDPGLPWTVEGSALRSRSRNTAFEGRKVRGRVVHTILHGRFTLNDGKLV